MTTIVSAAADVKSRLAAEIDARREVLIALTQDLIRIPTVNPPGDNYLAICDYLRQRLSKVGYAVELVRGVNKPGDSDAYPRWNAISLSTAKTNPAYRLYQRLGFVTISEAGDAYLMVRRKG